MALCLPPGHRLSGRASVALTELEGERLLTASPPGTPYTDLLLERLARQGVSVVPTEARITGGAALPSQLASHDAIAIVPVGTATPPDVATVALDDDIAMPLLLLWSAGLPSPAVARLRQTMGAETNCPLSTAAAIHKAAHTPGVRQCPDSRSVAKRRRRTRRGAAVPDVPSGMPT